MKIADYKFKDEVIVLDANEFERCTFDNCRLTVQGFGGFKMTECQRNNCRFEFAGPALMTLQIMSIMYNQGGKDMIEAVFKDIREGKPLPTNKG